MMEMEQQYAEQGQQEGEEMEVSCSLENAVHDANRDACWRQKNGISTKMAVFSLVSGLFFLYIFQNNYGKDMHVESGIVECRLCPFSLFYQNVKKARAF
jgi:hypothetical protein